MDGKRGLPMTTIWLLLLFFAITLIGVYEILDR